MVTQAYQWIGPWMIAAAAGLLLIVLIRIREAPAALVLLFGSVVGIAEQIRIHEETSFSKHVAFGLIFASPLIGALLAYPLTRRYRFRARGVSTAARLASSLVGICVTLALMGYYLQPNGWTNAKHDLTEWAQDEQLVPALERYQAQFPNKHILGDAPSPERYAMRTLVKPGLWNDTYVLYYKGLTGPAAYRLAVSEDHFGVIYLTDANQTSRYVHWLLKANKDYVLRQTIRRYVRSRYAGYWLVFTLRAATNGA
jgi:hypothetical protein